MATTLELQRTEKDKPHSEDDLTDEQIEELLARAAARLQEKAKDRQLTKHTEQSLNFPKLDAGDLEKPYVSTKGDVATIDSSRLLDQRRRLDDT